MNLNSSIKFFTGIVLIGAGLLMLLNNQRGDEPGQQFEEDSLLAANISVDLNPLRKRINSMADEYATDIERILPLIVLKAEACAPCIDNVAEYSALMEESDLFFKPTVIFLDEEKYKVERFLLTSKLDLPFVILDSEKADSLFLASRQNLIFIDPVQSNIFYQKEIPNALTHFDYKDNLLANVSEIWKNKLEYD